MTNSDFHRSAGSVEAIAKWLHEETEHPDSYPDYTWPETDRDDGRREGGWVKIVPQHAQAYFRDIARRMVAQFGIPGGAQSKQVTIEVIASALRIALDSFERDVCIDSLTENEIMHLARVAQVASQPSPAATVETTNFPAGATGVGLGGVSQREQNPSAHNGSSAGTEVDLGPTNAAFHRALKKFPDAFEALHYFWNEGIAGQPQEVREPTVWLVEWPEDDTVPVRWWNPAHGWMRDANKALGFARKTDADCYLSTMKFGLHLKVTEHKFVSSSLTRPQLGPNPSVPDASAPVQPPRE